MTMAARKSYVHGTEEALRYCKPRCVRCVAYAEQSKTELKDLVQVPETVQTLRIGQPPPTVSEILSFLRGQRFSCIEIDHIQDQWAVTIISNGDKYRGFSATAEEAFLAAIRRVQTSDPVTGPITLTRNQTTHETSEGHADTSTKPDAQMEHLLEIMDSADDIKWRGRG